MKLDLKNTLKAVISTSPVSVADTTAQVGTVVDMAGFDSLLYVISIGSVADADATFTVLVEDSPTNSVFTAVDDKFLIGTEAAASFQFDSDDTVKTIGYSGWKRYVRLTVTPVANASAALFSVTALKGMPKDAPVA